MRLEPEFRGVLRSLVFLERRGPSLSIQAPTRGHPTLRNHEKAGSTFHRPKHPPSLRFNSVAISHLFPRRHFILLLYQLPFRFSFVGRPLKTCLYSQHPFAPVIPPTCAKQTSSGPTTMSLEACFHPPRGANQPGLHLPTPAVQHMLPYGEFHA
jgi:hypothetical protein